jgi:hypothetical protein
VKAAQIKTQEVRCQATDCRKLGKATIRKWGRNYGPYCEPHAAEIAASQDEFDRELDELKAEIAARPSRLQCRTEES